MNLVTMKQKELDTLSDERLGWACMEPTFQQIRAKSPSIKSEVISKLTDGQKALCMFRVMHDHSRNSEGEYYAWISYMQDLPGDWTGVIGGIRFLAMRRCSFCFRKQRHFSKKGTIDLDYSGLMLPSRISIEILSC